MYQCRAMHKKKRNIEGQDFLCILDKTKQSEIHVSWASLVAQLVKNSPAVWETWVRSLALGRSPEEGKGYPLQYSGLENSMDCIIHGIAKSQTRLSDLHFHCKLN